MGKAYSLTQTGTKSRAAMNWARVFGSEDDRQKRQARDDAAKREARAQRMQRAVERPGLSVQGEGGPGGIYYQYDRGLGMQGRGRTARAAEMKKRKLHCEG